MKTRETLTAILLSGATVLAAGEESTTPGGKAPGNVEPKVPLRVEVRVTRRSGGTVVNRRPYALRLQTGDGHAAETLAGSQVPIQTMQKGEATVAVKDVGTRLRCSAQAGGEGRYRLDLRFDDSSLSRRGTGDGEPPALRLLQVDTRLPVRSGEVIPLASVVDPADGQVIDVELAASTVGGDEAKPAAGPRPVRLELDVTRQAPHSGAVTRRYSLVVFPDDEKTSSVFVGTAVPIQTSQDGSAIVQFKNVGVQLVGSAQATSDGAYRLNARFEDSPAATAAASGPRPANPTWGIYRGESRVTLRPGEKAEISSAVDPLTGDRLTAELTVTLVK